MRLRQRNQQRDDVLRRRLCADDALLLAIGHQLDQPVIKALDDTKQAVQNFGYRAHSKVIDIGTKIYPVMFPMPEIRKGCGSVQQLPEILRSYGVHSPMIVTGPTIGKTIVPPIVAMLADQGFACTVFDRTEANPSVTTVEKIRDLYRERGCDGFLAIGGGSPMDAAKIAAAAIAKPGQPIQKMAGMMRIIAKVAPIICVPTTAGTGSEVTIGAVISDHDTHHKYAITAPCVTPKAAILDPELTVSMPPFITATTGVDALTHAVESYVTCMYNTDKTNKWCEDAVVSIFRYLERAYNDPNDMEAREQMLYASCTTGLAFTCTGVGYVHGIVHALGGLYNTAYGLANSVILPIVLEDYGAAVYPKLARLAELTEIQTSGTEAEKARAFIAAIRALNMRLGLPTGFDFIRQSDYETIAKWALEETNVNYPAPVLYDKVRLEHVLNRIILEA